MTAKECIHMAAVGDSLPQKSRNAFWAGRIEALLLILIGSGTGWLAIGERYSLLMNPSFRWLTLAGAILVCAMGMAALARGRQPSARVVIPFLLLGGIILLGNPLSRSTAFFSAPDQRWAETAMIDDEAFPLSEMRDIQAATEQEEKTTSDLSFSVAGTVHHVPTRNGGTQTVLMRSYMVCCVADAYAIGFRLAGEEAAGWNAGDLLVVSGTLRELSEPAPLHPARMGTATFPVVNAQYAIEPAKIVPYAATLPTLQDRLASESTTDFVRALKAGGLWEGLAGDGPFTIFAPLNGTMDDPAAVYSDARTTPEAEKKLKNRLSFHIVPGRFTTEALFQAPSLQTVHQRRLQVQVDNGKLYLEGSKFLFKNMIARNGVVHIIHPALGGSN
jgi:uncharacterized surface protein with fasciclin (FAS1) repeats